MRTIRQTALRYLLLLVAVPYARAAEAGAWMSDVASACKVFNPHPQQGETVRWSGACVGGLAEGRGTLQWLSGGNVRETNEGEWQHGHQVGSGTQVWPAGRYQGELTDGIPQGRGVMELPSGRYEGLFRDGKADGAGSLAAGGKIYQGTWRSGCLREGKIKVAFGVPLTGCP